MTTAGPAEDDVGPDDPTPANPETARPLLRRGGGRRWSVAAKFYLVLGVLLAAVVHMALVGLVGFNRIGGPTAALYDEGVRRGEVVRLLSALSATERAAFELAATEDPVATAGLQVRLGEVLIPAVTRASAAVAVTTPDGRDEAIRTRLAAVDRDLATYDALRRSARPSTTATADLFEAMSVQVGAIVTDDAAASASLRAASDRAFDQSRWLLYFSVAVCLAIGLLVIRLLVRDLVPRVVEYSRFATEVASGEETTGLHPRGTDEVADLGRALNALVATNSRRSAYETKQAEYVSTLQVTSSEEEAHDLVQRHIETSVPGTTAVVLARNNSANRLEAVTPLRYDNHLAARLMGAEPRSCLAVRFGRTHHETAGTSRLLTCGVCADPLLTSVCEPLLVGGEVIGSVLVGHTEPIDADGPARVHTAVIQAAPVLANLRNLSLAEFRANNDALTGLPNKLATGDALKRMVAQANRSVTPLAAVMLDLDHFKLINDQFGHAKGDEVLAAVGAALRTALRASDFAGRFGGEEFLILLPETTLEGAFLTAEKIRLAVAATVVPGMGRPITASLGIADLLRHAGSSDRLLREADRALYAAKAAGRNRTLVATTDQVEADPMGDVEPPPA